MEAVFIKLVNMSITASWLVLAVIAFRLLFKKAPKWMHVCLWALVGIRLVCPFSLKSMFSLVPSAETVPSDIMYSKNPEIHTGISAFNSAVNPIISESLAPVPEYSANPLQVIMAICAYVWIAGVFAMLIYSAISYLLIRRKVREAAVLRGNVMICDSINTPFILGVIKPLIYLPSQMSETDSEYVIAHEKAHLKRCDHLWKPLGFLILSVYWFNPVLWFAYVLLCRDIELACDEKVIKEFGNEVKKPYSEALINCSVPRKAIAACPLAFGETGVKGRIKSVLSYKKPAFWIIIAALIATAVITVCFLTDPGITVDDRLSVFIDGQIAEHHQSEKTEGKASCIDWEVIGVSNKWRYKTVYMWVLYEEYSFDGEMLKNECAYHTMTAVTVKKENGAYKLIEYWTPRDGSYYADDIRSKVPLRLYKKALDSQRYIEKQKEACLALARDYFDIDSAVIGGADGPTSIVVGKKLTLEDVISLSKKGEDLKWSDFDGYSSYETGSGLYIEVYQIDEMFELWIGGSYNYVNGTIGEKEAMYFYLRANDGTENSIDIRYGDVEEFIEIHKNNPLVKNISAGWHLCPVGPNDVYGNEIMEYWGMPKNGYMSHILYLPVIEIRSTEELKSFTDKIDSYMDFSLSYPDKDNFITPAFDQIKGEYNDEFFKDSVLFLVYISSGPPDRYSIDRIMLSEGMLSIAICETRYRSEDTSASGWLMCINVSADQIEGATEICAFISSSKDSENVIGLPDAGYVYTASEDTVKPHIMLYREGNYQLSFSAHDSSLHMGNYHMIGDRLILTSYDGTCIWSFRMDGSNIVFDKTASSDMFFENIPDGAVFELALPYEPTLTPD